jgi:DNA-binding GntR family transcriptional regulator
MPVPKRAARVGRRLLRDDVYERIRDAIVDGTLEPGEQLRDEELAAWLGVSRTPIREAVMRLAEAGLVEVTPGRSTRVGSLDLDKVRDARDVVAAMHELAVREATVSLTHDDLEAMREANRQFAAAIERGDTDAALRADDDLHGVPVRVASNGALTAVLEQYTPVLRRVERLRFSSVDARASVARHEDLITLCAAGDAEGAAAVTFGTWESLPTADV